MIFIRLAISSKTDAISWFSIRPPDRLIGKTSLLRNSSSQGQVLVTRRHPLPGRSKTPCPEAPGIFAGKRRLGGGSPDFADVFRIAAKLPSGVSNGSLRVLGEN